MTKAQEKSKTELLRMGCAMWAKERRRAHSAKRMAQRAWGKAHGAEGKGQKAKAAHS